MKRPLILVLLTLAVAAPAAAQDIAFRGWGLRAGVSDDPDQFVFGAQANFGEFVPRLRFQPSFEIGLGDDTTIFSVTAPVFYRLLVNNDLTLYGGGGITLAGVDEDQEGASRRDDTGTEFEIAPTLAGGIEWPFAENELFLELAVSGGDLPSAKLMLGWMF